MPNIQILSWNVNGVRAGEKNGFVQWLEKASPDILCLQETKADVSQLSSELIHPNEYQTFWHSAQNKKGYSGTSLFTKYAPIKVWSGISDPKFDCEGRTLCADFGEFLLYNVYFPNGKANQERLDFKMAFYEAFLKSVYDDLKNGRHIIICGDVNTAHTEIDLARPKENEDISGFLPMERAWIDRFLGLGFSDTLRMFHHERDLYTWWSMRSGARKRNVGWRIDYFYVSDNFKTQVQDAFILSDVYGSDHCPCGITLNVSHDTLKNRETLDAESLKAQESSQKLLL